ncbi:MAG: hypothetical protein U1E10_08470 [Bdellovibrionales bacterium]|jgi:hypothetical protein|nr:hypothetical protein [Bdellovibrionales bacterium]
MRVLLIVLGSVAGIVGIVVIGFVLLIARHSSNVAKNAVTLESEFALGRNVEKILDRALELGAKEIDFQTIDGSTIYANDNELNLPEVRKDYPQRVREIRDALGKHVDYRIRFILPGFMVERWIVWFEVRDGKIAKAESRHVD